MKKVFDPDKITFTDLCFELNVLVDLWKDDVKHFKKHRLEESRQATKACLDSLVRLAQMARI